MIYLTRRERFCAAHRMFRQDWSDAENQKIFGKCSNPNWHGHNYILWVTVKGEPSAEHGFVMNINILKQIILENVVNKIDHKNEFANPIYIGFVDSNIDPILEDYRRIGIDYFINKNFKLAELDQFFKDLK
jgi:6-pyruvoyl tetrahydropterin synthase/QueD family protein